ncbi:MAG: GTP-binding protein, partial [Chloroflexi bacterium]|nr:GTP-binding protein [Chloroflexota bacterium]
MRTLNLGILAHVDAGKTTLSEQLLFATGAIDRVGSVDAGPTQTDSLEHERDRGITIRAAVASFLLGELAVNLVDTPGHPDFIAEVERVLGVLDGAILVVSAVEGVQPQTPLLFRALQRANVPTLIFVNKVDRAGADPARTLDAMRRRLAPGVIPMTSAVGAGTRSATVEPLTAFDPANRAALLEALAEHDEEVLRSYVGDEPALPAGELRRRLADLIRRGLVYPVYVGSAGRGVGIDELLAGLEELLPPPPGDVAGPVSGRVFKIERTAAGERVAYVRMFSGTLRARQRVRVGGALEAKPTSVRTFAPAGAPRRDAVVAGEMATVRGLGAIR